MTAYYNEFDPFAAEWLRNLIAGGHIAPGIVDERSIEDVKPGDLAGFTQCHFFAGVGVWSYALRRAGWGDDRRIWTGSCPCQPFSAAGKGDGFDDERHLWPALQYLISQCRPPIVIGEQVASKPVDDWIDLVHADLEALGYAFGSVPFPSAGVGAPHIRDRNYWVGYPHDARLEGLGSGHQTPGGWIGTARPTAAPGEPLRLADSNGGTCGQGSEDVRGRLNRSDAQPRSGFSGGGVFERVADSGSERRDGRIVRLRPDTAERTPRNVPEARRGSGALLGAGNATDGSNVGPFPAPTPAGPTNGFWRDADWLGCRDGKWRPVEPGTFPLAHGTAGGVGRVRADQERLAAIPERKDQGSRVGRLRGYGNAINAEAAVAFILALN